MAILPEVPYIRVRVLTSGVQSVEYDDPHDAQEGVKKDIPHNKMSVYIESQTNQKFGFEYWIDSKKKNSALRDPDTCFGFYATIDGRGTSSVVVCNKDGFKPQRWTHQLTGDRLRTNGDLRLRPFLFADFKPRDDSTYAPPKVVSQLGELVVQVWRVHKSITVSPPTGAVPARQVNAHESQLKGKTVSHTTEFGAPQISSDRETFYKLEYIDPISKPLAEFHFKYRSREILEQMMILSPVPHRMSTKNLDVIPRTKNPLPRAPIPAPLEKKPVVAGRDVAKAFGSSTTKKHKAATEMTIPPRFTMMNSVITGRLFSEVVSGTFSSRSAPQQAFGHVAPTATTGPMITSTSDAVPATSATAREEVTYSVTPALGSISQVASSSFPKARPAMPVETPAKAIFRPDVKSLASTEPRAAPETPAKSSTSSTPSTPVARVARAAPEPAVTPFTRVLIEINKNLSLLRDIAKGFSTVDVVEVRDQLLQVENEIRAEVGAQVEPEQVKPENLLKRERVVEKDDDLEFVLERPVKRRHIFTEADEIIDLTAN
ncbi:hypothetical protein DSL72_001102 [Monilinia vaccinii-corymbosi]|uniref:DUF7918 domain-containing protein n=1 Tax=Monilinia vaccinii-corymbosi TaxID=61207 RepID=A0A8A3P0W2_9HELO|nr:hypothetical protein DSL72_001102 [Monilinia vaccinii-corymbosi]